MIESNDKAQFQNSRGENLDILKLKQEKRLKRRENGFHKVKKTGHGCKCKGPD